MKKRIEFTSTGHSAVFGNFSAGDQAELDAHLADHFVHDAMAAKFIADEKPAAPVIKSEAPSDGDANAGDGAETAAPSAAPAPEPEAAQAAAKPAPKARKK